MHSFELPVRWASLLTAVGPLRSKWHRGSLSAAKGGKSGELIRLEIHFGNHLVCAWAMLCATLRNWLALRFIFSEENKRRALQKLTDRMCQQSFDTAASLS
jgi:hypothetical protein